MPLQTSEQYLKQLLLILLINITIYNEHFDFEINSSILVGAASSAFGKILSKFETLKNVGYKTFNTMYHSQFAPIMEYGSRIWGYGHPLASNKNQFRAIQYFLGIDKKTALLALGDMGWKYINTTNINTICFWNKIINMDECRLIKTIFRQNPVSGRILKMRSLNWISAKSFMSVQYK